MEDVNRRRRLNDLHVVIRSQLEKPREARAGVLWTLTFEAMRKQMRNAAQPPPFVCRRGNKLIDDDLGHIPEIAELRLPRDETIRSVETVPVFKSDHSYFGQRTVVNFNRRLVGRQVLK